MSSDVNKRVVAIQGIPVAQVAPTTDQLLIFDGSEYVPSDIPSLPPSGTASGDLGGTYPAPTVGSLTGVSNVVSFPSSNVGTDLTLLFNTSTTAHIEAAATGSISIQSGTGGGGQVRISSDSTTGGFNGPVYITSGASPTSLSGSCHNIYLDAGGQNGTNQGSIFIFTGYSTETNPGVSICLDTTNASQTITTAQLSLTCEKTNFNSTGLCFSQMLSVNSTYTVNAGRTDQFDYILLADTTGAAFTIFLPPAPAKGDTYILKDGVGNAGTNNLTIDGNGFNIDGTSTYVMTNSFECITTTYDGSNWLITSKV